MPLDNGQRNSLFFMLGSAGAILLAHLVGSQPEKPLVSRSLIKESPAPREPEKTFPGESWKGKVTNPPKLNSSSNKLSTASRSAKDFSDEKFLTSKNNSIEITPLKDSIRKYPPEYYHLNKKNQWLYRKALQLSVK